MYKNIPLLLILAVIDYIWLKSTYGKLTGGKFVAGIEGALKKFASENPFPFVKSFLEGVAIPNASTFGFLTMWGEALVALSLLISLLYLLLKGTNNLILWFLSLGLLGGAFLNTVFYLSSGWTSPSSEGLNLLMLAAQFIAAFYFMQLAVKKA